MMLIESQGTLVTCDGIVESAELLKCVAQVAERIWICGLLSQGLAKALQSFVGAAVRMQHDSQIIERLGMSGRDGQNALVAGKRVVELLLELLHGAEQVPGFNRQRADLGNLLKHAFGARQLAGLEESPTDRDRVFYRRHRVLVAGRVPEWWKPGTLGSVLAGSSEFHAFPGRPPRGWSRAGMPRFRK